MVDTEPVRICLNSGLGGGSAGHEEPHLLSCPVRFRAAGDNTDIPLRWDTEFVPFDRNAHNVYLSLSDGCYHYCPQLV